MSIVATAILLDVLFSLLGIVPESGREVAGLSQFAVDYTFWLNPVLLSVYRSFGRVETGCGESPNGISSGHESC